MKTFSLPSLISALVFASAGGLVAQTFQFSSVSDTPILYAGAPGNYSVTENAVSAALPEPSGTAVTNNLFSFNAFNVRVVSGTGDAAALDGQDFLAFCVNLGYPGPATGVEFGYGTDASGFGYVPTGSNGADYWGVQRIEKFNAIKDVMKAFGAPLAGGDQNSAGYQEWIMALTLGLNEIVADFGTADFGRLDAGDLQVSLTSTDPDQIATWANIQSNLAQIFAEAGSGNGADFTLFTASIADTQYQDLVMIPVPEPSAALLTGAALLFGVIRRRRDH